MGKFSYKIIALVCILIFLVRISENYYSNNFLNNSQGLDKSQEFQIIGYIQGLPSYEQSHVSFDFVATNFIKNNQPALLHLTWYGPRPLIQPGTGWELWVKLKSVNINKSNNFSNFNYPEYLQRRGYTAYGSVEALKPWARRIDLDSSQILDSWRFTLHREILHAANNAGVSEAGGILLALGIGDSSGLTQKMWKILQDTGTSHLITISGLHIGLIGLLFYGVIRRLWALNFNLSHVLASQKAAALGGFLAALGYTLISGLGIPAERTLIMLGMAALYQFRGRTGGSFKGWFMAFCICLALQPWGIFSISMWLSFLAVFSLIYLLSHRVRAESGVKSHLKFQFALYWLLIPATLYSFGMISTVAYGVNFWAIPLVSFLVVPVLCLGMFLMSVPGLVSLSYPCFYIAGKGALLWFWGLNLCAKLPYAGIYLHTPLLSEVILGQIGMFWAFAPRAIPGRFLGILWAIPMFYSAII